METFTEARDLVVHDGYGRDRLAALAVLDLGTIDPPIRGLVRDFALLPQCFTLQCCWGHFVCSPSQESRTLESVAADHIGPVRYRIAYLAVCIENSPAGRTLREALQAVARADPDTIQFGSPEWYRHRCPNAYALQVEPARAMTKDEAILSAAEARHVQAVRDRFLAELRVVLAREVAALTCPKPVTRGGGAGHGTTGRKGR